MTKHWGESRRWRVQGSAPRIAAKTSGTFKESKQRQEQLLLKLDKSQRKAEADARERDQATMLKLAELFMKNK